MMRRAKSERGAALIEAAITIPLLLLISVGIFEFGRAWQTWQVLTNAAREGARLAVLPDPTAGGPEARAREYMMGGQLPKVRPGGGGREPVVLNHGERRGRLGLGSDHRLPVHVRGSAAGGTAGGAGLIGGRSAHDPRAGRDEERNVIAVARQRSTVRPGFGTGAQSLTLRAKEAWRDLEEKDMARMRITLVLLLALAAGGGLAFGTYSYMQNVQAKTVSLPTRPVVVAATGLDLGAALRAEDLRTINWPAEARARRRLQQPAGAGRDAG